MKILEICVFTKNVVPLYVVYYTRVRDGSKSQYKY